MSQPAPFQCTHSDNFPSLLRALGCSVLLSTYQAGKVIVLSEENGQMVQLPRHFDKPMGLALDGNRLAVATRDTVTVLVNAPTLAAHYPGRPGKYDAVYAPRAVYFTGEVDMHDMAWSGDELWGVNTRFSCLCQVDHDFSFYPQWHPPFISGFDDEDRCHLNGMAMVNGKPQFATALGATDTPKGWRENKTGGGILMHVPSGEILLRDLAMPHSPRIYDGHLYLLLSAEGALARVDLQRGTLEVLAELPAFVRGLDRLGDFLFIGMSKLRPGRTLGDIPLAQRDLVSGLAVYHLPAQKVVAQVTYQTDCEEIYDVQVMPGKRRPTILGVQDPFYRRVLTTPLHSFWGSGYSGETPPHPAWDSRERQGVDEAKASTSGD